MVYIAHRSGGGGAAFQPTVPAGPVVCRTRRRESGSASTPTFAALLRATAPEGASVWESPALGAFPGFQIALITLWMAFRMIQRAFGRNIVGIMSAALLALWAAVNARRNDDAFDPAVIKNFQRLLREAVKAATYCLSSTTMAFCRWCFI